MIVTRKIEVGVSSNLLHSISTSICIRKCNKNLGWFRSHRLKKTMGYSLGYFSKIGSLKKMVIHVTWKIEVGIGSNLLHSISTLICIRKCNKNLGWFGVIFLKKPWAIHVALGIFQKLAVFKKMVITWKIEVGIGSNLLHSISTSICIRKCNKIFWWFRSHFLKKTMGYSLEYFSKIGSFFKMLIHVHVHHTCNSNLFI